ncbi:FadR/GntR family transcriptional regulator [Nitratireductor basaltis]|uniref:Transcriptional regulator n=1 Tax=Nitratireductor basaltis TaxID=472175 RepID=A0A084UER9_9HYPH|nr:FadR/GntR family transcriptional regulator [Nitratireductor basaltis]KFB11455.1 Transcriptional regulator [Nitratireductor basaltis]
MLELPGGGRRYLEIAQNIAESISAGTYKTGDRLPPERELAATLGVSRTTVREALLALEIMRFVEIRIGSGVFVLPENLREKSRGDLLPVEEVGPWEVLEARRMVEGESAFRAAQRATEKQIAAMEDCLRRMEARIDDIPRFDQADAEFHMLIAAAAGNSVVENYVAHLWQLRGSSLWNRWYDATRHPANRRQSVEDHKAIFKAIKRGLPEVAKTAMCAHIDVLAERFFDLSL